MHLTKQHFFGEVIESSLQQWKAQTWQWDYFPRFGSLVTIQTAERTLFGVVYHVETGSNDPSRLPYPYQKTEAELLQEQPHIFEFLKTTCTCLIIGYQEENTVFYHTAPQPPKIHAFVGHATVEQMTIFFQKDLYLPMLFGFNQATLPLDELILIQLQQMVQLKLLTTQRLICFMQLFSLLTHHDYRRLKLFLQRAQTLIPTHQL
ncbi:MAG: hypothetical protein WA432_01455 [Candidatus Babeliaceae bacterium]